METRINEIEDGLNTCLRCQYYIQQKCGAYFPTFLESWSEEDFYMSSQEERDEREALGLEHRCEQPNIYEAELPFGEKRELIPPKDAKKRRRLLARCQQLIRSAHNGNPKFWEEFGKEIDFEVMKVVAELDFCNLEDGEDILQEIDMMDLNYSRQNNLYPFYPEKLVSYYLREIQNKKAQAGTPQKSIQGATSGGEAIVKPVTKVGKAESVRFSDDPIEDFKQFFSQQVINDYLSAVLLKAGYRRVESTRIRTFYRHDPEYLDKVLSRRIPESSYEFLRWKELKTAIGVEMKKCKEDEDDFRKFVFSMLIPFHPYANYFWYDDNDTLTKKESAVYMSCLEDYEGPESIQTIIENWPTIQANAKAACRAKKIVYRNNFSAYQEELAEAANRLFPADHPGRIDPSFWIIKEVYTSMEILATLLVGCMLENGIAGNYLGFQKDAGVTLIHNINRLRLTKLMGWTPTMTSSYIKQYEATFAGVRQLALDISRRELPETKKEVASGAPAVAPPSALQISGDLEKYLNALRDGGYVDASYHWIKRKGVTNYHAGWAAKIMIAHIEGLHYGRITDIIGVSGLADHASKCDKQGKASKKSDIEACFRSHDLPVTVY